MYNCNVIPEYFSYLIFATSFGILNFFTLNVLIVFLKYVTISET